MELTHSFEVPAGIDDAWARLMDLEQVGSCFPGATVDSVKDDEFSGSVKVKLGPISMIYNGSGRFTQRDDQAHTAVIEASGKDKRGNGTAGAIVRVALAETSGGTRADVVTDLNVTGKPAQFGRGVMQDVSDKLLSQFVSCMETQMSAAAEEGTAAASAPSADSVAAQTESATSVTSSPSAGQTQWVSPTAQGHNNDNSDNSVDLGRTVLPVLAKSYGPYAVAGLGLFVLGWLLGRGRKRA